MALRIFRKREDMPAFDPKAVAVRHIACLDTEYEQQEITEQLIQKILQQIPQGINLYLSLDADGEDNWMEVNCDGEWIALNFLTHLITWEEDYYFSYNPDFADSSDLSPLHTGGQSIITKYEALQDIPLGVRAVEYFIRTGKLYPGIDWAQDVMD